MIYSFKVDVGADFVAVSILERGASLAEEIRLDLGICRDDVLLSRLDSWGMFSDDEAVWEGDLLVGGWRLTPKKIVEERDFDGVRPSRAWVEGEAVRCDEGGVSLEEAGDDIGEFIRNYAWDDVGEGVAGIYEDSWAREAAEVLGNRYPKQL